MSNLDHMAVYFFVRGDLREEDQMVQATHAILEMAMKFEPAFSRYRIVGLDGGQSEKAFNKTRRKMNDRKITHVEYADPDYPDWGVTAIATIPLTEEEALPLRNYRLRRYSPVAQSQSVVSLSSGSASEMVGQIHPGEPFQGLA